jgi:hypothetical protein
VPGERVTIACVIEGHGEVRALPKLLHRIAQERAVWNLNVPEPFRRNRGSIVAPGGIEKAVQAMAHRVESVGGVLVLIDADDDCPAELGPSLVHRARQARPDIAASVVLANREFEAWFLAAAPSLAGHCGLGEAQAPADPEKIQGAKEWLTDRRTDGGKYSPTVDQAVLASRFDMKMSRVGSPSFDKFCREVEVLLGIDPGEQG